MEAPELLEGSFIKAFKIIMTFNIMNLFFENTEGLVLAVNDLFENNVKLRERVQEVLYNYKHTRRGVTNKTQLRLYYKSIEFLKHNLTTDLAINILTDRLRRFARWFSYMWNNPSLCQKTFTRLSTKFPYRKTRFLRRRKIWAKIT